METTLISAIVVTIILSIFHIILLVKSRRDRVSLIRDKKIANVLCRKLYNEYRKVRGKKWASVALTEIIKDVVNNDSNTTRVHRAH